MTSIGVMCAALVVPTASEAYYKSIANLNDGTTPQAYSHLLDQSMFGLRHTYRSQRGRSSVRNRRVTIDYDVRNRPSTFGPATMAESRALITSLFNEVSAASDNQSYSNDSFADSSLDLRALISHRCFEPVGDEVSNCRMMFGPYYNLKESMLDGSLYDVIVLENPEITREMRPLYELAMRQIRRDHGDIDRSLTTLIRVQRKARAAAVWDICAELYSGSQVDRCFARHDRLYLYPGLSESDWEFNAN